MVLIAMAVALCTFIEAKAIWKSIQRLHDRLDFIEQRLGETYDAASEAARIAGTAKQVSLNAWNDSKTRHSELLSRLPQSADDSAL